MPQILKSVSFTEFAVKLAVGWRHILHTSTGSVLLCQTSFCWLRLISWNNHHVSGSLAVFVPNYYLLRVSVKSDQWFLRYFAGSQTNECGQAYINVLKAGKKERIKR